MHLDADTAAMFASLAEEQDRSRAAVVRQLIRVAAVSRKDEEYKTGARKLEHVGRHLGTLARLGEVNE